MDAANPSIPPALLVLALLGLLALLAGSVAVWVRALARISRGEPLVARQPHRPVPWGGLELLLCAAIYILVLAAASGLLRRLHGDAGEQAESDPARLAEIITLNALATLAGTACAVAVLRLRGATWQDLGLARSTLLADCRLGLAAFLFIAPGVYALQFLLSLFIEGHHPLIDMVQGGGTTALLLAAVSAILVAPLCEEWLFRVMFQGWLQKLELLLASVPRAAGGASQSAAGPPLTPLSDDAATQAPVASPDLPPSLPAAGEGQENPHSPPSAQPTTSAEAKAGLPPARGLLGLPLGTLPILMSAAVFSLLHSGQGPAPIPLFVFALCLGYLYRQTHRLMPSLVVHLCLNSLSMLMLCLMVLHAPA